jgi:hypothetical protein
MASRSWQTHAQSFPGEVANWAHFGTPFYILLYGSHKEIVPVRVIEDPEGDYMGWVRTGSDQIDMVLRSKIFDIQFPYGHQAEMEAGKGEAVRLRVERKED